MRQLADSPGLKRSSKARILPDATAPIAAFPIVLIGDINLSEYPLRDLDVSPLAQ